MTAAPELGVVAPSSPFRGLSPFGDSELDALLFFGREREAEVIAANLMAAKLTVLYGPSGVGKTSVVRAGVAQRLRAVARDNMRAYGEPGHAVAVVDAWSGDPVAAIASAAEAAVADVLGEPPEPGAGPLPERLGELAGLVGGELYLVLDQFEEYFLYHGDEQGAETLGEVLPELVTRTDLRVGVLVSLRDDALAQLDAFKARVPSLFANSLRLDRLDRRAARAAVLGPVEAYNELAREDERVDIEPALVAGVLEQVAVGRIDHGRGGRGQTRAGGSRRVEAPYLQLVLQRVWDAELAQGSRTLRLATLAALGGAERIVERHLEGALGRLTGEQRDAAAAAFHHLVTPSGTKIAHAAPDLARYAAVPEATLRPVLAALAADRVLRPLGGEGGGAEPRYEIFHDVLSDPVLAWRERHETETALARQREDARRRHRRMVRVLSAAFVALALVAVVALYALYQRNEANQQATVAREQTALAEQRLGEATQAKQDAEASARIARRAEQKAEESAAEAKQATRAAQASEQTAQEEQAKAEQSATEAERSAAEAEQQEQLANDQRQQADAAKEDAEVQSFAADAAAAEAGRQERHANAEAENARRARRAALAAAKRARLETARAERAARENHAKELTARSLALVTRDPHRALRRALEASALEATPETEAALRAALQALRLLAVLPAGGGAVRDMVVSADGRLLATGSERGGVRLFDVRSGRLLRVFGSGARAASVALGPDNSLLVAAGADGRARIYSRETGALLRALTHDGAVTSVEFSHDGTRLVTASADGTARIWDPASGLLLRTLEHDRSVRSATFSPDDRLVLTLGGDANAAIVFDSRSGGRVARLPLANEVIDGAFSPNGELVATSGRRNVRLWETRGWDERALLTGHTTPVVSVEFSPDSGRLVSASTDGTARLWRTDTGALLDVLTGHDAPLSAVAFSPDGATIATASTDKRARLTLGRPGEANLVFAGHRDTVSDVGFSPREEKLITISNDGDARIWSIATQEQLLLVGRHEGAVSAVAYEPGGAWVLSAGADGWARLWTPAGALVRSFRHGAPIVRASLAKGGTVLLTAGADGNASVWRTRDATRLAAFAHGSPIRAAALSPDATRLLTGGDDGRLRIWDVPGERLLAERGHGGPVTAVAFSPDGTTLASGSEDALVRTFRASDGRLVRTLRGHTGQIVSLAFAPVGGRLASAGGGTDLSARIWTLASGSSVVLEEHQAPLTTIRYSPDGALVLTAGVDGDVRTWSASGALLAVLRGHVATVADAVFSPDSRWVVTAGPGAAGVWRSRTGARLFYLRGHESPLRAVGFSSSGGEVITGGADGTVRRYRCILCGDARALRSLALTRLRELRLASEAARGGG